MQVVPLAAALAKAARGAFVRFGKGRHPAELDLGDCAVYALAADRDAPLLFKGDDFRRTDLGKRGVIARRHLDREPARRSEERASVVPEAEL